MVIITLLCAFVMIVEEPEQPFMSTVIYSKKLYILTVNQIYGMALPRRATFRLKLYFIYG